ncbi:tRNA (adenosine(37)-N6)-threonylcarbamoyltransferase complex dimerization subunit type 1 TsaB [bacterium]|nr:tRNA (adenosine(37)-N6)-threonylcarbamoyltransferase complex dimerization subunit type 1 TsaB [bacterium]
MSIILGVETATKVCSVAITSNNKVLAFKEEGEEFSHAEKLNSFVQETLKEAGVSLKDIDAFAVSKGPGSYTGLRIGVSTVKGFCYALNKPLISVDTLQSLCLHPKVKENNGLFCPMIDARRMEVYTAIYNQNLEIKEAISAKIIDEHSFEEYLKKDKMYFFGDGAMKCESLFSENENAVFIDDVKTSAVFINELAQLKLDKNELEDVAYFEPYYLKNFIATTPKKLL